MLAAELNTLTLVDCTVPLRHFSSSPSNLIRDQIQVEDARNLVKLHKYSWLGKK